MGASRQEISDWFDDGKRQGAAFLIVVTDTFDWDDYPVMVTDAADFWVQHDLYDNKNLQRIQEVYDLSLSKEDQMNEFRAWHVPPKQQVA